MLIWDLNAVAKFLRADVKHEDNSSYTLRFQLWRSEAVLKVFPYTGEVDLRVFHNPDSSEASVAWSMDCSAIEYQCDEPDEGGEGIAFLSQSNSGSRASHYLTISRNGDQFELFTVFHCPD